MDIQEFLAISIVGVGASLLMSALKSRYGSINGTSAKAIILGVSVALGAGFYFLAGTTFYQPVILILGCASTVYAFFMK